MPELTTQLKEHIRLRLLCYGAAKMKKTWWAGKAAEAGYNVLFINGDQGTGILRMLSPEAQKRVYIINAYDTPTRAVFAEFMTWFLKGGIMYWDEVAQRRLPAPNDDCIMLDPFNLSENTVVINDSWTVLSWSIALRYCIENSIDLSDAEKTEWPGYAWSGALATWMIEQWKKLPCHSITIGHENVYDKYEGKGQQRKIVFSKTQIKSISNPHAMQLAKEFTDIFYFTVRGAAFQIDTSVQHDRDGGSQTIPPKVYSWDALTFAEVCNIAGIALPPKDLPLLDFTPVAPVAATNPLTAIKPKGAVKSIPTQANTIKMPVKKNAGLILNLKK